MPGSKKIILVLVAALSAGALAWFSWREFRGDGKLSDELFQFGLENGLQELFIHERSTKNILKREVTELHASGRGTEAKVLYIPDMTPEAAEKYLNLRLFTINSQFNPKESAYPGAISKQVECDSRFLPKIDRVSGEGWDGIWVRASATKRKRLGDCDPKEQHYSVGILIAHCSRAGKIFDIEVYSPIEKTIPGDWAFGFSCRP